MTNVLSIDPGGTTTGIVLLSDTSERSAVVAFSWSLGGSIEAFVEWWINHRPMAIDMVVCEQFVQRNVKGADLSPLRLQGVIEALCYITGLDIELQPAGGKNTAVTDEAMKRAGFDKSIFKGDHHQDRWEALRHGLWYLKRKKHLPTLNAMYPR